MAVLYFWLDASQFVGGEATGCMVSTWCRSTNHQSSLYKTAANLTQLFSLQTRSKYFPLFSFYFAILSSTPSQSFNNLPAWLNKTVIQVICIKVNYKTKELTNSTKKSKAPKSTLCLDQHGSESQFQL